MKNQRFSIGFDEKTGFVNSIVGREDPFCADLCHAGADFCVQLPDAQKRRFTQGQNSSEPMTCEAFSHTDTSAEALHRAQGVEMRSSYAFSGEDLVAVFTFRNSVSYPVYFREGDCAFQMPFRDQYLTAKESRERCVHVHVWPGLDSTYIRAERMGVSRHNVGLAFSSGSFSSYSVRRDEGRGRGVFLLNASPFHLLPGEEKTFSYRLFSYADSAEFDRKRLAIPAQAVFDAPDGYAVERGERLRFSVRLGQRAEDAEVTVGGRRVPFTVCGTEICVDIPAATLGERRVVVRYGERSALAVFHVSLPLEELIRRRVRFIVKHQQCLEKDSPLYGAYLIYDNEEKRQFFDYSFFDYNACRERFGMALLLAKWLSAHPDAAVRRSLSLFCDFLLRECVEERDGTVYNNIGKDAGFIRLYNAPWVMELCCELYGATGDSRWAHLCAKIVRFYYSPAHIDENNKKSGADFYPNGIRMHDIRSLLERAADAEEVTKLDGFFRRHAENILKNGVDYPPHEVSFEQTIVTPALTLMLDAYRIFGEEKFLDSASEHLAILERFDGDQPHYRFHGIPIRHWDGFWFGKLHYYGDTFPHYWSVLSGFGYVLYGKICSDETLVRRGMQNLRAASCLFRPDGSATCAHFPAYAIDSVRLQCDDPFANDQDFALYFYLKGKELADS